LINISEFRLSRSCNNEDAGFAILLVLLLLAVLSSIAALFVTRITTNTRATSYIVQNIKAEALANAGARLALLELERLKRGKINRIRLRERFSCRVVEVDNAVLEIVAQDVAGKIDLNTASPTLLELLFLGLMNDPKAANSIISKLLDYRDNNSEVRPQGAEQAAYEAAGLTYGPKNGPLDSVEELEQVLGVPSELYKLALPHITVNSRQSGIDVEHAAPQLLTLLRNALPLNGLTPSNLTHGLPLVLLSPSARRTYRVFVTAKLPSGVTFRRDTVIELSQVPNTSAKFRRWMQSLDPQTYEKFISPSLPQC